MADSTAAALAPLIGTWTVEAAFPRIDATGLTGASTFSWLWEPQFVLQTSTVELPEAPDGHINYAPDVDRPGQFIQHYFDSRGVVRIYAMTFDGRTWTMERSQRDFSAYDFGQRFVGELSDDGNTITSHWDIALEPGQWQRDLELTYRRVG